MKSLTLLTLAFFVMGTPLTTSAGIIGPSEAGYTQVYGLNIDGTNYHSNVPYYLNNAGAIADGSFTRIAYHMELKLGANGPLEYVWVSVDAFTAQAAKTGVPSFAGSNTVFQQLLTNMNVFSNKAGITTGTGLGTGNIEFWPINYLTSNALGIPNASGSVYDTGDQAVNGSYGSMQIHNHAGGVNQTLFALNRFGTAAKDVGIGNQSGGSGHPDWTFAVNSGSYTIKTIDVWVGNATVVPEPGTFAIWGLLSLVGSGALRRRRKAAAA